MIFIIFIFIYIACMYIQCRNDHVYKERQIVRDIIFNQEDYEQLLKLYHSVSYNNMMLRFWVWPIRKMWPNVIRQLRKK